MTEYMIVYREFKRGRRSIKTDYTLATSIRDAQMAAQNWIKADVPLGSVVFVRKVG